MKICDLFIWDDERGQVHGRNRNQKIPTNCNNCEMILTHLRKFRKDISKKFGKEFDPKK